MGEQSYVYVIAPVQDGWPISPVKVGITSALSGRLSSLQTGSSLPLICVQAFPVPDREIALALEKAFHTVMDRFRMAGEWFDIDPLHAVRAMTDNIEQMLVRQLGFEGDELEHALTATGVIDSRKRLLVASARRDEEIIRTMQ